MRAIRKMLKVLEMHHGFKRFTAFVEEDSAADGEWMEALGFQFEGRHPNWAPGGTSVYVSYGRVC